MLDIHPPEHTPHTWRDFLIHIATICVGLLIAVGLEQGVEYFHHRHQYHRLQEDMLAEAQRNSNIIAHGLAAARMEDAWTSKVIALARSTPVRNGYVDFQLPPKPAPMQGNSGEYATVPSRAVWPVATANGLAGLVPSEEAQIYNRLDYEATESIRIGGAADIEDTKAQATLDRLGLEFLPGEHIHLTPAQVDDFLKAVTEDLEMGFWGQVRLAFWKGASDALLHHVSTMDQMFPYMNREASTVPKL